MDPRELARLLRENTEALKVNTGEVMRLRGEIAAVRAAAAEPPPAIEDALGGAAAELAEGAVRSFFSGAAKGKARRKKA